MDCVSEVLAKGFALQSRICGRISSKCFLLSPVHVQRVSFRLGFPFKVCVSKWANIHVCACLKFNILKISVSFVMMVKL